MPSAFQEFFHILKLPFIRHRGGRPGGHARYVVNKAMSGVAGTLGAHFATLPADSVATNALKLKEENEDKCKKKDGKLKNQTLLISSQRTNYHTM